MKIMKELRIRGMRFSEGYAPLRIELGDDPSGRKGGSFLELNEKSCKRFGIPMSTNLIGRTLACVFESYETDKRFGPDTSGIDDDMEIRSLCAIEETVHLPKAIPPQKHEKERQRVLTLSTRESTSFSRPCPFYHITLELTEEEYEACKALPATVVMRANYLLEEPD